MEDGELVAERQDLRLEFDASSEAGPNGGKEGRDAWAHDWCTVSAETGKLNRHKVYGVSDRDTSPMFNRRPGATLLLGHVAPMIQRSLAAAVFGCNVRSLPCAPATDNADR
jgi:hypothetical protein